MIVVQSDPFFRALVLLMVCTDTRECFVVIALNASEVELYCSREVTTLENYYRFHRHPNMRTLQVCRRLTVIIL